MAAWTRIDWSPPAPFLRRRVVSRYPSRTDATFRLKGCRPVLLCPPIEEVF